MAFCLTACRPSHWTCQAPHGNDLARLVNEPPSLAEWLSEDHLARFMVDVVESLLCAKNGGGFGANQVDETT